MSQPIGSPIRRTLMTSQSPWRFGVFYFDKNDPRIWAPKRTKLGWTLNFAHNASWLVLAALTLSVIVAAGIVAYSVHVR
jgi:uncharacterized membrane protein